MFSSVVEPLKNIHEERPTKNFLIMKSSETNHKPRGRRNKIMPSIFPLLPRDLLLIHELNSISVLGITERGKNSRNTSKKNILVHSI